MTDQDPREPLAEMKVRAEYANEQWQAGRGTFNANHHAPPVDDALADLPKLAAALEGVLEMHRPDLCPEHGTTTDCACGPGQCISCDVTCPCPTERVVTEHLGDNHE